MTWFLLVLGSPEPGEPAGRGRRLAEAEPRSGRRADSQCAGDQATATREQRANLWARSCRWRRRAAPTEAAALDRCDQRARSRVASDGEDRQQRERREQVSDRCEHAGHWSRATIQRERTS